jgi:hypothetical protein
MEILFGDSVYIPVSKREILFGRCGSNLRPEIGRTSFGIPPIAEKVTGLRIITDRIVNGLRTLFGRSNSDIRFNGQLLNSCK